jgi:hypothetical protein
MDELYYKSHLDCYIVMDMVVDAALLEQARSLSLGQSPSAASCRLTVRLRLVPPLPAQLSR